MIEITSYVLGMLTIAAVLLLVALVIGMVKINKLEKELLQIEKCFVDVDKCIDHERQHMEELFKVTQVNINAVEQNIMNQLHQVDETHRRIEDEIHKEIDQTKSYIDSRVDRVVATGTLKSSKQLIK
jgi:biopolymer transport protein ExbB/TolQ